MRHFLLFFCIFAHAASHAKQKQQFEVPKPLETKVIIAITDKMYSKKSTYEASLNKNFIISENLSILITKCLHNGQNQEFVFVKAMRDGEEFFKKWVPIQENAINVIEDKRYDITFNSCNFYEKPPKKAL